MNCHKTSWELNMLWNEKISFVNKAYQEKYFDETEWYGWILDILEELVEAI
jgi:hypothetical protein